MVILCGRLDVVVVEAKGLTNLDQNFLNPNDKSDPYCIVEIKGAAGSHRIGKTFTIDNCLNPKWFYKFSADIRQDVTGLCFIVKDRDILSSETIGESFISVKDFANSERFESSLNLSSANGSNAGELFVSVKYSGSKTATTGHSQATVHEKVSLKAKEINRSVNRVIGWRTSSSADSFASTDMMAFLHGALDIVVERATNLPNLDSSILSLNKKDVSDPYINVSLHDTEGGSWKVVTTSVIDNNLNPIWNEKFRIEVCHNVTSITFDVRDKDFVSSEIMGSVMFSAESIISSSGINGTFDLFKEKSSKKAGQLSLSINYKGKQDVGSESHEVPECLFPMREHNKVTLYQDAHCPMLPAEVVLPSGYPHCPRSTWRDMYETITQAQKFIYIVGWSVSAKIALLRWPGEDTTPLGHLLLAKANEGVRVRLLLWDELTSNDLRKSGAMSTEDEETSSFFKGTPVVVKLAPRDRHTKDMFSTKNSFTKLCYTHHQKCLIADKATAEMPGKRHVIAFVGGLDLTGGRFDTPEHPLFRTLVAEHRDDFRNRMHPTTSLSGPREPWHDIHSCVEGPAAMDVLSNFQERWDKQGDVDNNIMCLQSDPNLQLDYQYRHPGSWSVQMFRSINSDSAVFDWQTSVGSGLTNKKGRAFDNSLHRAYIHNIRRAKRFIYIENQYFLGSSHAWLDCRDAKAGNLVPLEISAHIEEKIMAGEPFVTYIVTPMFPEGKPADKVTQEILHWQFRTMQMMYDRVAKAIANAGLDAHPQDYLLFLCLANKESNESVPPELLAPEDPSALAAFEHRRLMIYVHSKMAVFDDEYFIIGSANINDRSLSGNRDTEIAIGGYQPSFVIQDSNLPFGDVGAFRHKQRFLAAKAHVSAASVDENIPTSHINIFPNYYKISQGLASGYKYQNKIKSDLARTHVITDKSLQFSKPECSLIMSGDLDPVDHRYIVAGKNNGGMGIYDSTREEKKKFIKIGAKKAGTRGTHLRGINCIQWYPMDAGLFSTSSSDSLIKIWDPNSLTKVDEFNLGCRIHYHHMSLVASRHSLLAAAGETGDVILCDLRTGSSTHRLHGHDGRVQVVQWTKHNENHVSSGGRDNCIRIWDVRSGKACLQILNEVNDPSAYDEPKRSRSHSQAVQSHSSLVTSLCYSYDGLSLISLSYDGVIKIWDTASYKLRKIKFKNTKNYFKKAFSIPITHNLFPDVIYVPNKHNIAVFDISTGERIHVLKAHCSSIYGAIYNPVSGDLYSFGEDKNFLVWTPSRLSKPKEWKELLEIGNGHDRSMADNWSSDED